jgi:hypothetical protein
MRCILQNIRNLSIFQINAEWYNKKKGFYSKIDMDARIPKKWRLKQGYFDKNNLPETFPANELTK